MPTRGRVTRFLIWAGVLVGGPIAAAGGVVLGAPGAIAVAIAGIVVGALAFGLARESVGSSRRSPAELAWRAAAATVGLLLVVSGLVVVAGGVTAALVCGLAAIGGLTAWLLHLRGVSEAAGPASRSPAATGGDETAQAGVGLTHGLAAPSAVATGPALVLPPVSALPTAALGREWLLSTAALTGRLEPGARSSVVRRRRETLDELERRDPAGFARWMAGGPAPGSDPATFVRGDETPGSQAA